MPERTMRIATPGPWLIKDDQVKGGAGLVIWGQDSGIVAFMQSVRMDDGTPCGNMANAYLIAAAPDLLASLDEFRAHLVKHATLGINEEEAAMLKRADEAIRKARVGDS